uniref:CBO0543 family protein n=1 Tax=Oceanobacillus sp. FSL K6-2867 TaxID=2954748 RepID=UPI00403F7FED
METFTMNTVKHWKESKLPFLQKKHSYHRNQSIKAYLFIIIFSSFIGTYLDLLLVGSGLYFFPKRPLPEIFTINILFTLCALPVSSCVIIFILKGFKKLIPRCVFLFICSLFIYIMEQIMEQLGFFVHSNVWKHEFSLFGYFIFFIVIWKFYNWLDSY